MQIEHVLILAATAVVGWLARHHGWFVSVAPAAARARAGGVPAAVVAAAPNARAEIDSIVKEAVASAMSAALTELRTATVPVPAK